MVMAAVPGHSHQVLLACPSWALRQAGVPVLWTPASLGNPCSCTWQQWP
jgi:hypothetical protein